MVDCQVSRSQILKSATSYIQQVTDKNQQVQLEINKLKKMNRQLEQQGKYLTDSTMLRHIFGSATDSLLCCCCYSCWDDHHQKSLRLHHFKLDRDEIRQECSRSIYTSIDGVWFLMWRLTFKMAAMGSFHAKKYCRLVHMQQCLPVPILITFVLVLFTRPFNWSSCVGWLLLFIFPVFPILSIHTGDL